MSKDGTGNLERREHSVAEGNVSLLDQLWPLKPQELKRVKLFADEFSTGLADASGLNALLATSSI